MQNIRKLLLQLCRRLHETITIVYIHILEVSGWHLPNELMLSTKIKNLNYIWVNLKKFV